MAIDTQDMEVGRGDDVKLDERERLDVIAPDSATGLEKCDLASMMATESRAMATESRAVITEPHHDTLVYEVAAEFPPKFDSPGCARRLVVAALREWECEEALVDDVALAVTELASNAVLHAGTSFSISLRVQGSMLRVAVGDGISPRASGCEQGLMTPQPLHGLDLIDVISTRWGVEGTSTGKVVWAELACDVHSARRFKPRALA